MIQMIQASVVCRELGYQYGAKQATQYSHFGNVSDHFKMDDVRCHGRESSISQCTFLDKDDCVSSEGAGVICKGDDFFPRQSKTNVCMYWCTKVTSGVEILIS